MAALLAASGLPPLRLRGRTVLPIVQGGMGVGVSAHRLAGAVAAQGAVGTIASVDLRRHHPDLMEETGHLPAAEAGPLIDAANLVALDREIRAARALAGGHGMIAVNVMRAVTAYPEYVRQACRSGADAIVMGAGLPLDLPDLAAGYPDVALIPILSDLRGIQLVVRKWQRKGRLPDAIVIEHPRHAGGHLGATRLEELEDARFDFETVVPQARAFFAELGLAPDAIPLIPAGGIDSHARVRELLGLGAAAVQLGTAFAVTQEGDAHPAFKEVLAGAGSEQVVEFMSVAGLPARAVATPWLVKHLAAQPRKAELARVKARCVMAFDCLIQCGLRDGIGKFGQFCIDRQLAAAVSGDVRTGLFFRGAGQLPFGDRIRPVGELVRVLLGGAPAPV
ncbi:MAG: nitronate monooxygenase [Burkholderiales bacterium]|nr:MAG: nitronate monooxygenase [Burkholderiales bacterium]